jgi:hypothetical protein
MQKNRNLFSLFWESIIYAVSGGIIVGLIFGIEDYVARSRINNSGFGGDYVSNSIGMLWVLLGLGFSALLWNLVFRKTTKYFFLKWFFISITSTISTVLMQMAFLISNHDMTLKEIISAHDIPYLLGFSSMLNLFTILTPFTFLFAVCLLLINKRQNQSLLK